MNEPIELKFTNAKNDITKFIEITGNENGVPPFVMVGILSQILTEWQRREIIQLTDAINKPKPKGDEENV